MARPWRTRGTRLNRKRSWAGTLIQIERGGSPDVATNSFFGSSAPAPITATGAATLANATGSATATVLVAAMAASTLAAVTGSATATVLVTATGAATLGDATGSATASVVATTPASRTATVSASPRTAAASPARRIATAERVQRAAAVPRYGRIATVDLSPRTGTVGPVDPGDPEAVVATPVATFSKAPAAVLDYALSWVPWLTSGDAVASATWTAPSGITIASSPAPSLSANVATVWLSGGTNGVSYDIQCAVTTTGGRTDERTIRIYVEDT